MDALDTLAKKNKEHEQSLRSERLGRLIVALLQVPLLFGIAIDLGAIEATKGFNLWLYGLGVLCFGLPVAAIGSLLLLPRWLKISALILMQVWFIYFWAFKFQSWLAFVPMLPAFLLLLVQASKILEKAKTTNDY